ncbi:MAG: LysM peptidoglycan-binding domain-containing protein [Thermoflexales bacterium]|nr:LysM peptidoglycan-binding domain-containing protein [Thermoflexales bacterium]
MNKCFVLCAALAVLAMSAFGPIRRAHATQPANAPREYVVQPGDTLLGIALAFGVSMASIQALNNLEDPSLIRAGQTLKIPAEQPQPGESALWTLYTVRPGDTLSAIAARFQLKVADLTRANQISEDAIIRVGQKLVIPVGSAAPAMTPSTPAIELIPLVPLATPMPASEAAQPSPATVIPDTSPAANAEIESVRVRLLELYNQARSANGVPPLAYSFVLQAAAQAHAEDCAARGVGSHIGSDGSRASQRIARAGYAGRVTGENWALARSADQAFEMWYTKEIPSQGPHLKNILSPRYKEVGFGVAPARNGYFFLIANFGG